MQNELTVFFTAMIPFLDLKLAIPLGTGLGLSATSSLIFATAGTIIPGALILWLIGPITNFLCKKSKTINNFFKKLFHKTRKEHSKNFTRYGALFLILFVAIPIPGSSAGAGALLAFLFGVDYWKALSLIFIGVVLSGIIVTAGTESVIALASLFNW
ncbi:small multi-drug export protein [Candidatus Peregrinibacteria bacterium]|nr:small multi-drug export protein [Candidatus Peregrinibacteria bacterium]